MLHAKQNRAITTGLTTTLVPAYAMEYSKLKADAEQLSESLNDLRGYKEARLSDVNGMAVSIKSSAGC